MDGAALAARTECWGDCGSGWEEALKIMPARRTKGAVDLSELKSAMFFKEHEACKYQVKTRPAEVVLCTGQ